MSVEVEGCEYLSAAVLSPIRGNSALEELTDMRFEVMQNILYYC